MLLGGTGEAVALNRWLGDRPSVDLVTSLAGRTRLPPTLQGQVISGGFRARGGLDAFLKEQAIDLVVDATHPFAAAMTRQAVQSCDRLGVAYVRYSRPPWDAVPGDRWIEARDMADAAARMDGYKRIFLSVGRQEVGAFAALPGRYFLVRSVEPVAFRPGNSVVREIRGKGPFHREDELALLRDHRIDLVVSKNSGGAATYAKIEAARRAGVPVMVISRPALPASREIFNMDDLAPILASFS
ncbi:precorrin-6A reductase [Sneathiella chinensis]|uniref:Precorrin-6A reductase n=1 Tax=Sneathiella chinensis TaxID=349750 RepID=A0ABQ5U378_9PROT|nr:precorrin-6A reductase [Sneathiella chinensis]